MNNPHMRDQITNALKRNGVTPADDLVKSIEQAVEPWRFEVPHLSEENALTLARTEFRRLGAEFFHKDWKPADWVIAAIRAAGGNYLSPFDFADDPGCVAEPDRPAHIAFLDKLSEWCKLDRKGLIEALIRADHANEPWKQLMELVGAWQDGSQTTVTLHQDDATKNCYVTVEGHGATFARDFKTAVFLASR